MEWRAMELRTDDTPLICVDESNIPLHPMGKDACHDGEGRLHRAFSVFLFDEDGNVLLQHRAPGKRLWPGYWSNSMCSHPRWGESLEAAVQRRLSDELGVASEVEHLFAFTYSASFRDVGSEREFCHVFAGRVDPGAVRLDPSEISDIRYLAPATIDRLLALSPWLFTPWFVLEWP